jgi:hypothetical protein
MVNSWRCAGAWVIAVSSPAEQQPGGEHGDRPGELRGPQLAEHRLPGGVDELSLPSDIPWPATANA